MFWSFAFPALWYFLTANMGVMPAVAAEHASVTKAILGISFGVFGAFTVALVGVAGDLATDLDEQRYRTFRSRPIAPSADLTGRFAAGATVGFAAWSVTVAVAALDGASYSVGTPVTLVIVPAGVGLFCLVGMVAGVVTAVLVTKPQHATTVGTGVLVVGFFVTGYNGTVPRVFPADPAWLNLIPNALTTRLLVHHLVDHAGESAGLVPPPVPASPAYVALLVAYGGLLYLGGIAVMRRTVYGTDVGG